MNKQPKFKASIPQKKIKVRVLREIPVWEELRPVVGKVYDAIEGRHLSTTQNGTADQFCVVEIAGKKIVMRNKIFDEPEYEVMANDKL